MKNKAIFIAVLTIFSVYCGYLVVDTGIFSSNKDASKSVALLANEAQPSSDESTAGSNDAPIANTDAADTVGMVQEEIKPAIDLSGLTAKNAEEKTFVLGSVDPESEFFFEVVLSSKGASIERARLNGFSERDDETQPLTVLRPAYDLNGSEKLSLANGYFSIAGSPGKFPLQKLNWQSGYIKRLDDGSQSLSFSADLTAPAFGQVVRLTKTYYVVPGQRHIECDLKVENLAAIDLGFAFDIQSAVGFGREAVRMDARKVSMAWQSPDGVVSERIDLNKLRGKKVKYLNTADVSNLEDMKLEKPDDAGELLWAATSNKYFAAIIHPDFENGTKLGSVTPSRAQYYDTKLVRGLTVKKQPKTDGSENVGFNLQYSGVDLKPKSSHTYRMQMYLGPKEKSIFQKNEFYSKLGFMHAIDFKMCCGNLFRPISFFILWLMKVLFVVCRNYGIVIILLVLFVRALLHPLTKKGQVSMMKMGKMGPRMEEIKKKYAGNQAELQKRTMELYREQGISPMLGFLPMMLQMPIWVSLYSAIYASIDLRGAKFLPFWITDLSAPDALVSFSAITIPFVGWELDSFNLLPILLGVAMFMQQKMMPSQASASANPQMAQQQKMMMWMMPVMMLVFLYKAPSGLNLYIMSSVFGGVIEQKIIRKHIKERDELEAQGKVPVTKKTGGKLKKKKPKPFFKY